MPPDRAIPPELRVCGADSDRLAEDTKERSDFIGGDGSDLEMNRDNHVGPHLAHQVRRQVVHERTVHLQAVSVADGSEDSRQGHGRPHSQTNRTAREHMRLFRNQLGSLSKSGMACLLRDPHAHGYLNSSLHGDRDSH